jgi:hypothetical protein
MSLSSARSRVLRRESRALCIFEVAVRIICRNRRGQIRIVRYRKAFRVVAGVSVGVVRVAGIHAGLESVLGRLADVVHAIATSGEVFRTVFSIDDPFFAGEGAAVYTVH